VFRLRQYEHVSDVLAILHWLRLPEGGWISNLRWWHIVFSMAWRRRIWINSFRYQTCQVVAVSGRHLAYTRAVRSVISSSWYYYVIVTGHRSFPVAATTVWNTLPVHVQSSPSIATFRQRLKTFLFQQSFPDIVRPIWYYYVIVNFEMAIAILAMTKIYDYWLIPNAH